MGNQCKPANAGQDKKNLPGKKKRQSNKSIMSTQGSSDMNDEDIYKMFSGVGESSHSRERRSTAKFASEELPQSFLSYIKHVDMMQSKGNDMMQSKGDDMMQSKGDK